MANRMTSVCSREKVRDENSPKAAPVVFAMLVAPGEGEMAVDTLLRSLDLYPGAHALVLDDATQDGTYDRLCGLACELPGRIVVERNDYPEGSRGMAKSMFRTYRRIYDLWPDVRMVIKIDPDTCVLKTGLVELADRKFSRFGPGMIGSYRLSPTGAIRGHAVHTLAIMRDLITFSRPSFYFRRLIRAMLHGYIPGHSVLGGLYILHGDTVRAAARHNFLLAESARTLKLTSEDAHVSMTVRAVGHSLIDINDPKHGEVPTWIVWRAADRCTSDQIKRNGYLAIHPVKNDAEGWRLRQELQALPPRN